MSVHIFYPENVPRADRLQMLINHIAIIQTDVGREKRRMDELDKQAREALDLLLKGGHIKTLDELNEQAMKRLTADQRQEYQALIDSTKEIAHITNTMLWIGLILGGEEIIRFGAPVLMSLARGVAALQGVQGAISALVGATGGLASGVTAAGEGLAAAAQRATQGIAESGAVGAAAASGKTGAAVEAATEVAVAETSKVMKTFKFVGKYGKWLSRLGVVLLLVVPLVEIYFGKTQKESLIKGIRETQVARLVIAALREEARHATQEMNSFKTYLTMLNKENKKQAAQEFGEELLGTIRAKNAQVNLTTLERDLRSEDDKNKNYHKGDDLSVENVVLLALREQDEENSKKESEEKTS